MVSDQNQKSTAVDTGRKRPLDVSPSVAAVVLNWNGRERLLRTVAALYQSEYLFSQIVIVDNGSTDASAEAVQKFFPEVVLLAQEHNLGPSEGRNVGIRRAIASGADYIFNVDNDIEIFPETVRTLIETADRHPDIGIVGPMMYFRDQPNVIQNVGGRVRFRQNIVQPVGWLQLDHGQFSQPFEVDMVGSAAMLTRREVFQNVGHFDANYIGYGLEDTDFCTNVRRCGWKVLCNPQAKVRHDFHFNHKYSYRRKYLEARNAVFYLRKYGRSIDWAKYLFFAVGGLPYAFMRETFRGNGRGVFGKAQGLFDALIGRDNRAVQVFLSHE